MPGIEYTIGANASGFTAGLQSAQGKLQGLTAGLSRIAAPALAIAGVGSLGAGLALAAKGSLGLAAAQEQLSISFATMLGSGSKAKDLLADIERLGASTPYEYAELANAGKSLLAFGIGADQITGSLSKLGDVASGVGIPLGDIADIYGKARVQGRLFAEDINQLTGRGIPIIGQLATGFGTTEAGVRKMVESGKVGFADLDAALTRMTSSGGQFFQMMERQSQSLNGTISTLKDEFSSLGREIGGSLVEPTKDAVKFLTASLAEFRQFGVLGDAEGIGRRMAGAGPFNKVEGARDPDASLLPEGTDFDRNTRRWEEMTKAFDAPIQQIESAVASFMGNPFLGDLAKLAPKIQAEAEARAKAKLDGAIKAFFDPAAPAAPPDASPGDPVSPAAGAARQMQADRLRQIGGYVTGAAAATKDLTAKKTEEWSRKSAEHLAKLVSHVTMPKAAASLAAVF